MPHGVGDGRLAIAEDHDPNAGGYVWLVDGP